MKKYRWMSAVLSAALVLGLTVTAAPAPVMAEEITEMPFTLSAAGEELTDFTLTEDGYTFTDWDGTETTVDLYTVSIPEGTESVDLTFEAEKLVYNYEDNEYLAGWVEDATVGATEVNCSVDANENGVYDILQIQGPYTKDEDGNWSSMDLQYAVTFAEVKNTTDTNFRVYADGKELADPVITEGGYTYIDYYGTATTVDLYTFRINKTIQSVDLEFDYRRLAYNYDVDGETYLAGYYDDYVTGSRTATCPVDSDGNGVADIIQVQNTYNEDWSGAEVLYAITFDQDSFSAYANGLELYEGVMTEDGYTFTDWDGSITTVDLYTIMIPEGTESVDLTFNKEKLVYNYEDNNYLAGWVEDPTVGSTELTCAVDYDGNGVNDILHVQSPYTVDEDGNWSSMDLQYAITFSEVKAYKAPKVAVANTSTGLQVSWNNVGAEKYIVYRKEGSGSFKKVKTTTATSYTDKKVSNGSKYTYYVLAAEETGLKNKASKQVVSYRVTASELSGVSSKTAGSMLVQWKKVSKATGYEICYSTKSSFKSATTVTAKKAATVSKTIKSLTKGKKYYVKVRAYRTVSKKTYYSVWSKTKTVTVKK